MNERAVHFFTEYVQAIGYSQQLDELIGQMRVWMLGAEKGTGPLFAAGGERM